MKYEITVEDLVPRHRERTVELPEDLGDTDDLTEYLNQHPELWRDTHLPAYHQTVTRIGPATTPEPLTDDQLIVLEWDSFTAVHHRAVVTIGKARQQVESATGTRPVYRDPVELSWHLRGNACMSGLDSWLNLLHAQRRAYSSSTTSVGDPLITGVRLATDTERDEHQAAAAVAPGLRDSTVRFTFTETSRGHGHLELAELAEAGAWQPGTPVTAEVLEEYFGDTGEDCGRITETEHTYSRITYIGPDDRSRR